MRADREIVASDTSISGKMNAIKELGFGPAEFAALEDIHKQYLDASEKNYGLLKASGQQGRAIRARLFNDWVNRAYFIKKSHASSDSETIYYIRRNWPQVDGDGHLTDESIVFRPLTSVQFKAFLVPIWRAIFPTFVNSSDIKEMYSTLTLNVVDLVDRPSDRWLYIGKGLAFDRGNPNDPGHEPELVDLNTYVEDNLTLKEPFPDVFYRFFDTSPMAVTGDNDIVMVPPMTPEMAGTLKESYNKTLQCLGKEKSIPDDDRIREIMQWAQNEYDRYIDIIHMASARLKSHDFGIYILAGLGRDGKSSCIDLVASMYGTNNICRVPVDRLGDTHNLSNFQRALVNLPDEQKPSDEKSKTMSADASVAFRIAGSHGAANMNVMRSNKSDELYYSFVTMAPVNSVPKFPTDVQNACIRRCRIIEFEGDFSASDKLAVKWGKAHFTPDFMMRFTGQVLAFASYYSTHDWQITPTMEIAAKKQMENAGSSIMYIKLWEKIYCGYDSYKTLRDDYYNYCKLSDYDQDDFNRGSILLMPYSQRSSVSVDPVGTIKVMVKKSKYDDFKKKKMQVMHKYSRCEFKTKEGKVISLTDGKSLEDFHNAGGSVIFELEDRGLLEEEEQQQLPLGQVEV